MLRSTKIYAMNSFSWMHGLFGVLLVLLMVSLSGVAEAGPAVGTNVGDQAPDFSIKTLDEKIVNLKEWRGKKAVYLVFWATWCPNCKREIPKLTKLSHALKDKMAFFAINVGINDSVRKVVRFQKKYPMNYPIAFDDHSKITKQFKVMGTPTQVIVDINGTIRYRDSDVPEDLMDHIGDLTRITPY